MFTTWSPGPYPPEPNGEYSKMRLEQILSPLIGYQRVSEVPQAQNFKNTTQKTIKHKKIHQKYYQKDREN